MNIHYITEYSFVFVKLCMLTNKKNSGFFDKKRTHNCLCTDVKGVTFDIFMIFCNLKNTLIFFEKAVNDISV